MRLWAPIATFLAALPGGAVAGCRLALALGLDVSGSVDSTEYRLQMDGLAGALMHPEVRMAMLSLPGQRVEMMVYEWSGPADQHVVQDWREVRDEAALADIAATLRRATRAQGDPSTAIGAAMRAGAAQLGKRGHCDHRVLDLSGDGPSNTGPLPQAVRDSAAMGDVTVNGLVIEEVPPGQPSLEGYFRAYVIRGPGAFTERAAGFADYRDAMVRKLIRELRGMILSRDDGDARAVFADGARPGGGARPGAAPPRQ